MNRPDVEGIDERLKELIAGPTYVEALTLIGWIKELEADRDLMISKFNKDLENAIDFYAKKSTILPKVKDLSHTIEINDGMDD